VAEAITAAKVIAGDRFVTIAGELLGGHVMLEDPVVVQGARALHLRYPVRR
jgi:hypothetical protein